MLSRARFNDDTQPRSSCVYFGSSWLLDDLQLRHENHKRIQCTENCQTRRKNVATNSHTPSQRLWSSRLKMCWCLSRFNNLTETIHYKRSTDGLVGYDAALTRLRSRVQFPVCVVPFAIVGAVVQPSNMTFELLRNDRNFKSDGNFIENLLFFKGDH